MPFPSRLTVACGMAAALAVPASGQTPVAQAPAADDPVKAIVSRLDLEEYKATIKGLTQFGDRRQGTKRNRDAVDWIEAQLKSYGCTNTERIKYVYTAPAPRPGAGRGRPSTGPGRGGHPSDVPRKRPGQGGSTIFGTTARTGVNTDPMAQA